MFKSDCTPDVVGNYTTNGIVVEEAVMSVKNLQLGEGCHLAECIGKCTDETTLEHVHDRKTRNVSDLVGNLATKKGIRLKKQISDSIKSSNMGG